MTHHFKLHSLIALSVACAMLAGCGGGDAEAPPARAAVVNPPQPSERAGPDTTPPTVTIANNVSAPTATGPVTFTFVFSGDVGISLDATDVVVTGGTLGAFNRLSGSQATVVVTPTPNATGTITVSVAAGTFKDIAGNVNTVGATTSKEYNTVGAGGGGGGGGGGCGAAIVCFDEAVAPKLTDFGTNGAPPVIATDPAGGTNKVLKVFKYKLPATGSEQWAGVTVSTGANDTIPRIPFTATAKTMTLRVYSPAVGVRVRLKVEDAASTGTISVETDALTTTAGAWETLTFNFANPGLSPPVGGGATSPLDLTKTYNKVSIFSDFGLGNGGGVLPADRVYYYDDITFVGAAGGGGGGGATAPTNAPSTVIPAGSTVIYSDATQVANFNPFPGWGQATQFSEVTIAGNKSLKYTALNYEGLDWTANPVDVSAKGKVHLDIWSPDITSVKFYIISQGPTVDTVSVTIPLTAGNWNRVDFDLSSFSGPNKASISQMKFDTALPAGAGTLYVDNIYFWGTPAGGGGGGGVACGTPAPTCAPTTAIPAGSTVIYSDAFTIAPIDKKPDWGQSPPVVFSEPTIAGNASLKYTFTAPALYEGIDWATIPQDVSTKGTLHLDVWTADVANVKVSLIGGGSENGITKTLTAGSWNSLDIDLSLYSSPDKTKIIQMKLEPNVAGTIYVDNIYFYGVAAGGGGGGGTFTGGIFASDYSGNLGAGTAKSDKNGTVGFFVDSRLSAIKIFEDGSVCGSACNPGGVNNFYYGIGKPATPTFADAFFGGFVNAPGNAAADASGFAKVQLKFWGDAESWEKPNFTAQVNVIVQGPTNAACTNPAGRPELLKTVAAQKIGAGSDYIIPKTDFVLTANCGGAYTVDSVWSAVGAVVVLLSGSSNLNYVNLTPSTPPSYPTFINIGPIKFIN